MAKNWLTLIFYSWLLFNQFLILKNSLLILKNFSILKNLRLWEFCLWLGNLNFFFSQELLPALLSATCQQKECNKASGSGASAWEQWATGRATVVVTGRPRHSRCNVTHDSKCWNVQCLLNHIQFCYVRSKFYDIIAKYTHVCHGFGEYREGLGAYDIIEKPAIYPHMSWIWGGAKKGLSSWWWYHTYSIVFFSLWYDIFNI
jgi:hypothetical protein